MKECLIIILLTLFGIIGGFMDIFDFLRSTIHKLSGTPVEEIKPESKMGELNLDLFDVEELKLDVENEYDMYLPDEMEFDTVEELAEQIKVA